MRRRLSTVAGVLLGALAALRLAAFLTYALPTIVMPPHPHYLEPKMVHLAWRYQHGLSLYPDWTAGPPYVCNFFGPLAFVAVGQTGRALDCTIDGLFLVGRLVSLGSTLGLGVIIGLAARARYGAWAGLVGGLVAAGSGVDVGFSTMTRPDALADVLGLAGFLLAVGRTNAAGWAGGALLVAAVLTKQTAGASIVAAGLGLVLEGRHRRAAAVVMGTGLSLVVLIGVLTWIWEPRLAVDLMGESGMAWDGAEWLDVLRRLVRQAPDLVVLLLLGIGLWSRPGGDRGLLGLALVMAVVPIVLMAKHGAGTNYAFPWRGVGALAAAGLVGRLGARPNMALGVAGLMVAASLGWGAWDRLIQANNAVDDWTASRTVAGRALAREARAFHEQIERGEVVLLTDEGDLDIRQGAQALWADPWLFRAMVGDGRIRPEAVVRRIEAGGYDLVVTRYNLMSDDYADYAFGLPMELVEAVRTRYRHSGMVLGLHAYEPMASGASHGEGP
jgi:hypothetical protein